MKKYIQDIVVFLVGLLIAHIVVFLVGLLIEWIPKGWLQKDTIVQRDTIVVHDTIEYTKEVLVEKTKVVYKDKIEYVYVDVEKTDTIYKEEKVFVQMPRQYYFTETDDVRIWHSGIDSTIDSLNVYTKTQNITETIRTTDKKNYLSVGAEAVYIGTPYIPVYVEYERKLHRNFSFYGRVMRDVIRRENGVSVGVKAEIGW